MVAKGQTVRCIDGGNLSDFSDQTQEVRYVREIILVRREVADFGRLRREHVTFSKAGSIRRIE